MMLVELVVSLFAILGGVIFCVVGLDMYGAPGAAAGLVVGLAFGSLIGVIVHNKLLLKLGHNDAAQQEGEQHSRIQTPNPRPISEKVWVGLCTILLGCMLSTSCCFWFIHWGPESSYLYHGPSYSASYLLGFIGVCYVFFFVHRLGKQWVVAVVLAAIISGLVLGMTRGAFTVINWELEQMCLHGEVSACAELGYQVARKQPEKGCQLLTEACFQEDSGSRAFWRCSSLKHLGCVAVDGQFCESVRDVTSGPCSLSKPPSVCIDYAKPCAVSD